MLTTIRLDADYALDQVFWQHSALLPDRLAASRFAATKYADPFRVVRLGETVVDALAPGFDELELLSRGPFWSTSIGCRNSGPASPTSSLP